MNNSGFIHYKNLYKDDNLIYCKIKFKDLLNSLKIENFEIFKFTDSIISYKIDYKDNIYTNNTKYNPINIEYNDALSLYNTNEYTAVLNDYNTTSICIEKMLILNNFEYIFNIWILYNLQIQYHNYKNINHISKLKEIKNNNPYLINYLSSTFDIYNKLKNNEPLLSENLLNEDVYFIIHHENEINNLSYNILKISNKSNEKLIINIIHTVYYYHKLYYNNLSINADLNIFKLMFNCYTSFIFNIDALNIYKEHHDIKNINISLFTYDTYVILLNNLLNNQDKIKHYFMLHDNKNYYFTILIYKAIYAAIGFNLRTSKNTLSNICDKINNLFDSENIDVMQKLLNIKDDFSLKFVKKYNIIRDSQIINTEINTQFYNFIKNNIIKYLEYNIKEITWDINI